MKTKQTIHILHHGFRQPYFSFAPDRNSFAILDREGILQIWDPATGRKVSQFSHRIEQNYSYLGFSPSGKFLLTHGYDSAFIWDIEEGTTVAELIDFRGYILGVGFTPDEKSVIISASLKGTTGFINRWYLDQWRFEEKITQCL